MTYPVSNQVYPVANAVAKTRVFITIFSLRNPTTADINYEPTQRWFNTVLNQEWILVDFTEQNEIVRANWHPIASSVSIITLTGNTGGPVSPDGANNINVIGDLASGINVVGNPPMNTLTIFNVNGLPLVGFTVDAFTPPGTNPVLPNSSGLVTVTGGQVAAGTTVNVIRTDSLAANTFTIEIQRSQAVASSTIGDNGVCHFNSADFTVDANGFVSLAGGTALTITGDTGGPLAPTAGNWDIFGQTANLTQVMETHNITNVFWIENRSWQTQYVVDTSTTVGLQGTYSTIQAALNAAVVDGMAFNSFRKIYVRTGTYTENLVIPPGAIIVGETIALPTGGAISPTNNTLIVGTHTFTGNAVCAFNNLVFTTASGNMFSGGASAISLLYFDNCFLANAGADAILTGFASSSYISMQGCTLAGSGDTVAFDVTTMNINLSNCVFEQPLNITIENGRIDANNTTGIGFVTLLTSASIKALGCTFILGGTHDYNIDSTASVNESILTGCFFEGVPTIAALSEISGGTAWILQKCATSIPGQGDNKLYANNAVTTSFSVGEQGNLIKSTRTATDLQMNINDYYVGVTSTAAPRTILLPDGSGGSITPQKDQVFIINDESGGAATNNITVTTSGGVVLIDGQTSQIINNNYGNLSVIFDGTNYFTLDTGGGSSGAFNYTNVTNAMSPYTVLASDFYLSVDTSGGAVQLNFPNAPAFKRQWIIKDRTGTAAVSNITLTTPGGTVTFDGLTSYILNSNYEAINLLANATPTYEVY
jgi:hypothetical protein